MPVLPGSVKFRPAATATAASAQLPPFWRISIPHLAARGCVQATMPFVLWTTDLRDEKERKSKPLGARAEGFRGIVGGALLVVVRLER